MPRQVIVQSSVEAIEIVETSIPIPKDFEVIIKVAVCGSNPKDWKYPFWKDWPHNSGDDMAGIVHSVGKEVYEFRPGDRVAALHEFQTPNGAFAEYATAPAWTTFRLPNNVSFEEAATIPTAAFTAAVGLYADMGFPMPFIPTKPTEGDRVPLLIYGVTSAVGSFVAKFARLSGLSPLIGVAGKSSELASTMVDHVVDYRNGQDAVMAAVEEVLSWEGLGSKVPHVFDAISDENSLETVARLLDPAKGIVCTVLPVALFSREKEDFKWPAGVRSYGSICPRVMSDLKDFGYVWARYMGRLLADNRLAAHPYNVVPGGLHGILQGLQNLRDGKASGNKFVFRIEKTPPSHGSTSYIVGNSDVAPRGENTHPLRNFPFPA